ncbi:hypothetical protein HanPSC8_Chr10g0449831 [Helianthus annuus]|nr:hypothetical protein HanPSC8_Chr10g0449831 [Helianthus annuus]
MVGSLFTVQSSSSTKSDKCFSLGLALGYSEKVELLEMLIATWIKMRSL